MRDVITSGKENTAMMAFDTLLSAEEIDAVIYFVREAFIVKKRENTHYHTPENGWFDHEQYEIAFPFVTGQIALDTPWESLSENQRKGKQLYLSSCISCHDRSKVTDEGAIWESYPLSWPRNGYSHKTTEKIDAISAASSYAVHDKDDTYVPKNEMEARGQTIFQENCAFCHAPDGTGKNWIGQFIEPHPRNFTVLPISERYTKSSLKALIQNGVEGSAMPAWRYVLDDEQIDSVIAYMWEKFKNGGH